MALSAHWKKSYRGLARPATDLHRTGQTESVNIYLLVPLHTVAVRLSNNLVRRDEEANRVARDKRSFLRDLMGEDGIQGSPD